MSAVAPIVAGTLQHPPSQPLPPQPPSRTSLNTHPSPMPGFISSDTMNHASGPLLYTGNHNAVMIQAQAQAQQLFRQKQLLAYQQQQQLRLQQQQQLQMHVQPQQKPQPVQTPPPPQEPPIEQQPQNKDPVEENSPLRKPTTNDPLSATATPTRTKRPGLNKRHSTGHAVLRLLQFAEQLDPGEQALQRGFWDGFISDFFTKSSKTKLGLRNSDTDEQRPFYISHYSVAKFFHTLYQSGGVSSIQLTLEQTMEFILPGGHMNVECPRANFIYRYTNGSLVSSTGHLWVRFSLTSDRIWKIKHLEFACQRNEEFVSRSHLVLNKDGSKLKKSNKNALPESPINAWGIPPKAFHILQMMDAAVQLDDIIFYSLVAGTTAKESLAGLAFSMEQQQTKDALMNTTLDTPDPPSTPKESLPSPPKVNKKRRKSLKKSACVDQPSSPIVKTEAGLQQQAFYQQQQYLQHSGMSSEPLTYSSGLKNEMNDMTQSPKKQFRKRSDSISEKKKSPTSRKKGKTTTSK